ncbi:MAG: histone deacetylase [Verrucomicrobiota bacterium]
MKIITHPDCTSYETPGHPERPQRISKAAERLKRQNDLSITWEQPGNVQTAQVLRAHTEAHLIRLRHAEQFDPDTPAYENIDRHALRSAAGALTGLDSVLAGETAFVLLRPPGHHATRDQAMGFCYLNQVAIAVLEAQERGIQKVAVLDFDVHHGNGTEAILLKQPDVVFHSVHQHPCYPGTGIKSEDNCFNYPIPPRTPREKHVAVIQMALDQIRDWQPELLVVSAGFDAYRGDPISDELLEVDDFHSIGHRIASLNCPHLHVLEGGYSDQLPELIHAYLMGLA